MIPSWLFLVVALSIASARQDESLDFSCKPFHEFLSESELVATYGRDNVTRGPVFGEDDGPTEGTILFENRADRRVEIAWRDSATRRGPRWIRVRGQPSRWHTPNGLGIGDDLLALERRNGRPFRLAGFTGEGHGRLRAWGGRLDTTPNCGVTVTFQPRGDADESALRQVTRLPEVSSGHPAMQKINPRVVALWIAYPDPLPPANASNGILEVLLWGRHMPIDPALYSGVIRDEVEQYLRRGAAYTPKRAVPFGGEMGMVHSAQVSYETRLVAISDDPRAPALAHAYVTSLRPCYEWEGFADCPEREAQFADRYQAANPDGPFSTYLPLLAAHRWLCAAEGYDDEINPRGAQRSRRLYEQRLSVARRSSALLIRTAAERLAELGQCFSSDHR